RTSASRRASACCSAWGWMENASGSTRGRRRTEMIKINGRIAAVAMGLLGASAGVLYPVQTTMKSAQADVAALQHSLQSDAGLPEQLLAARQSMDDVRQRVAGLPFSLCPATPDAQHEYEARLMAEVEASGLHSVRMDRHEDARDARYPTLSMDLV